MNPKAALLFAAGFGTRMGRLTADRPKPLIRVAGRTLLDHALALAEDAGVSRTVVNAHYRAEMICSHLAGRGATVSVEAPGILDTGGGLRAALPLLDPNGQGLPLFTLNTDAVWTGPNPLQTLRAAWDPAGMEALLLLVPRERATGHDGAGDFTFAADGRLTPGPGAVYSGAQIVSPGLLAGGPKGAFGMWHLWNAALAGGRLFGVLHPGGWCDVGRPEGIALAEAMFAAAPAP